MRADALRNSIDQEFVVKRGQAVERLLARLGQKSSEEELMEIRELKARVFDEFGERLEHATPANVRHFLDRMQLNVLGPQAKGPVLLEEHASSYEEVIKDFFTRVLELPKDEAVVLLWLLAFDLSFSAIELQQGDRFKSLFGGREE